MSPDQIQIIREMIEAGCSNEQIAFECSGFEAEWAAEDDLRSPSEAAYSDRLDMGRNDAGEWLGFM